MRETARSAKGTLSEPCTLITPADIERISSYAGAVEREVDSDSVCWWTVDDQRLGVSISVGRYVPTPFLGGAEVDLGGGLRGRRSGRRLAESGDPGGRHRHHPHPRRHGARFRRREGEYLFTHGDGRKVDLREQYEAYARQIVERLR